MGPLIRQASHAGPEAVFSFQIDCCNAPQDKTEPDSQRLMKKEQAEFHRRAGDKVQQQEPPGDEGQCDVVSDRYHTGDHQKP